MAVIRDPDNEFDFAYKGYQYPIPPTWKRAIRLEDQIQWLLQGLLKINAEGVSTAELTAAIDVASAALEAQISSGDAALRAELRGAVYALEEAIRLINAGVAKSRNPVTGWYDYMYVCLKQMYDMLRTQALTWDELDALNMSWDTLDATGRTWLEIDLFSNNYYGDGNERIKFTPTDHIDVDTPGFNAPGNQAVGRTWADITNNGFLMPAN